MKAIYCPSCSSLLSLRVEAERTCDCGRSWGRLRPDGVRAVIGGQAVPLAIIEGSLVEAVNNRPTGGMGEPFMAYVLAHVSPVVAHVDTKSVPPFPRAVEAF